MLAGRYGVLSPVHNHHLLCCATRWAEQHHKLFIASVGPGYDDSRIRPWVSEHDLESVCMQWWRTELDGEVCMRAAEPAGGHWSCPLSWPTQLTLSRLCLG